MTLPRRPAPGLAALLLVSLSAGVAGCLGRSAAPPAAGESRGAIPDLAGARVMVFPPQGGAVPGDVEAELTFGLESRAPGVGWIMPAELRDAAARSPGFDVTVERLPVGMFERTEVRRVGDPLYGHLRRLAALVDAEAALIPVVVRYRAAPADTAAGAPDSTEVPPPGRVEISAALVSVVSGRVLWFGVAGGEPGPPSDPAVLASAVDALARVFQPPARR